MQRTKKAEEAGMVIGAAEAAEFLGVSKDTLYRYANEGLIPAFRVRSQWRFHRELLDKWAKNESTKGMTRTVVHAAK